MRTDLAQACLNAHPSPQDAGSASWKQWTEAIQQFLSERFPDHDIAELIHARAELIDRMLQVLWREYRLNEVEDLALLAVGGYGRGELHPYSDIDVLALYRGRRAPEELGPFFQALWDGGLKLSQSVRTVHQCRQDARDDITLMTSWLEMRHLCGNSKLARDLEGN
ncbi:MAG: nucleotidyltransferase domain-containing protein, partial [Gammaproteobacteria bacterium]|nr:nucleotidyltransferase domain-containing protein [Gammaproteobacteria bacterium]